MVKKLGYFSSVNTNLERKHHANKNDPLHRLRQVIEPIKKICQKEKRLVVVVRGIWQGVAMDSLQFLIIFQTNILCPLSHVRRDAKRKRQ
jgi:hypothetical protein